jgi:alanine racemase
VAYNTHEIRTVINARALQEGEPVEVVHLLTDSRKLLFPGSTAFFALGGPRRSGGAFIEELYQKGVRVFIVDSHFSSQQAASFPGANFLLVENVLLALQAVAAHHRKRFSIPVIGITGSNGKTIVKEWLCQLLQDDYVIVRSPRSYNSQTGVPLSVWEMNETHTLAIFEAGISQPGEMEHLQQVIQPTIGVFTNIGEAHDEGFSSMEQKISEKAKLFTSAEVLIYGAENPLLNRGLQQIFPEGTTALFPWGTAINSDCRLKMIRMERKAGETTLDMIYNAPAGSVFPPGEQFSFTIPFTDEASIANAITCCAVLCYMGTATDLIRERMARLKPVEMRLELKQGINHTSVINDSYSADINSLTIALDFLQQQQQYPKRTVILSDILQSGKDEEALYKAVAGIIGQKKINRFIGIGPAISRWQSLFDNIPQTAFFLSTAEFRQQFHSLHFNQETILLKGARVFGFEQIVHLLEQQVHQTVLEINLNAITHNLRQYQQHLDPGVKLMAMVKAFSYGSGSFEIANLLQFHKVDYLAVAYADEGVELRKAGISLPIMVMNAEESSFDVMVQHNLEPELYAFSIWNAFEQYLNALGIRNYPVHIKLDTGMRRLGFEPSDIGELCNRLRQTQAFKIQSVFSHLAASDAAEHDGFTQAQAASFIASSDQLKEAIGYPFIRHIANTSAIHRHKQLQFDMVRLGIGLYGVDGNAAMQQQLRNVTTLKTTISQVKRVKAGDSVGYSRKGVATKDSIIATVRIGYADGYPRLLSNGTGKMWVNGSRVPVIGNVCMDMTMLDITGADAREGDEVIVFGEQLPVSDMARGAQTIAYEILTGISQRVKRVYYEE